MSLRRTIYLVVMIGVSLLAIVSLQLVLGTPLSANQQTQVIATPTAIVIPPLDSTAIVIPPGDPGNNPFIGTPVPLSERDYRSAMQDMQIVYLSAAGAVNQDSLLSDTFLQSHIGLHSVHSWSEVETLDAQKPIQTILIHESARDIVDTMWLRKAMLGGVIVVRINMGLADLAEMTQSECIARDAQEQANPYKDSAMDYFVLSANLIRANNPYQQELLEQAVFDTCDDQVIKSLAFRSTSYSYNGAVEKEDDLLPMFDHIGFLTEVLGVNRQNFENPNLQPTAIPELPLSTEGAG